MLTPFVAATSHDLVSVNWTLVAELIAFLILLYFLVRLLYRPLTTAMAARAERIRAGLASAEDAAKAAQEAEQRTAARLEQAKAQAQEILGQANASAQTMREQIVAEARAEAERVIERGRTEIERERRAAVDELRGMVGELAIQVAAQVVQKSLDTSENRRLVEDAIQRSDAFSAVGSS